MWSFARIDYLLWLEGREGKKLGQKHGSLGCCLSEHVLGGRAWKSRALRVEGSLKLLMWKVRPERLCVIRDQPERNSSPRGDPLSSCLLTTAHLPADTEYAWSVPSP